jgi:hypothetical protein
LALLAFLAIAYWLILAGEASTNMANTLKEKGRFHPANPGHLTARSSKEVNPSPLLGHSGIRWKVRYFTPIRLDNKWAGLSVRSICVEPTIQLETPSIDFFWHQEENAISFVLSEMAFRYK